jgi:hypothetical protein
MFLFDYKAIFRPRRRNGEKANTAPKACQARNPEKMRDFQMKQDETDGFALVSAMG